MATSTCPSGWPASLVTLPVIVTGPFPGSPRMVALWTATAVAPLHRTDYGWSPENPHDPYAPRCRRVVGHRAGPPPGGRPARAVPPNRAREPLGQPRWNGTRRPDQGPLRRAGDRVRNVGRSVPLPFISRAPCSRARHRSRSSGPCWTRSTRARRRRPPGPPGRADGAPFLHLSAQHRARPPGPPLRRAVRQEAGPRSGCAPRGDGPAVRLGTGPPRSPAPAAVGARLVGGRGPPGEAGARSRARRSTELAARLYVLLPLG